MVTNNNINLAALEKWQSSTGRHMLASAWEYFISTGRFPEKSPRSIICQSWMRSRELGIDPNAERATTVLSLEEIEEKLRREDLGKAGLPVIRELIQKFDESRHVLVLADHTGCILHSVGHQQIQRHLDEINFMPGANWLESSVGPNGVGTPLSLREPEVVMGHEHYCRGWQPWVCYGAPIFDAGGKDVIGVIDITGPINRATPDTMILAMSVAQSIQYGLNVLNVYRRENLRLLSRELVNRWSDNGVILVDHDGYIIDYNTRVQRFLKDQPDGILDRPISALIPGIWDAVYTHIRNNSNGEINVDLMGDFGIKRPVQIHIEPVSRDDRYYGAVLVLSGNSGDRTGNHNYRQKPDLQAKFDFDHIRGSSTAFQKTIKLARAAAQDPLENNVLIIGETGTGKELIAHSIHTESIRGNKPFIPVNCSALPGDIVESELFGHVNPGHRVSNAEEITGRIESARGGTLFLDDIGSLDLSVQGKLMNVLENRFHFPGNHEPQTADIRIIAASNQDIANRIEKGAFRQDLYHRLGVIEIPVPPLRYRDNDVIVLANSFLEEECWYANRKKLLLSDPVIAYLRGYQWPGNVRELQNLCLRWVLTVDDKVIRTRDLPEKIINSANIDHLGNSYIEPKENLRALNDEVIAKVLEQTGGNISRAAKVLGINRTTIYRRMKKTGGE